MEEWRPRGRGVARRARLRVSELPARRFRDLRQRSDHGGHPRWRLCPIQRCRAGDLVGVLGIGGLGHLGIQYAAKSGYRVVGIGRGPENAALAKRLGAFAYIDSKATTAAEELRKLGGAKVILATAPNAKAIADLVDGLSAGGELLIVGGAAEPMEISAGQRVLARRDYQGRP